MGKHNKYYYEFDRNMDFTRNINPKSYRATIQMSKEELGLVIEVLNEMGEYVNLVF